MKLSLVIPAYNESEIVLETIRTVTARLAELTEDYEVLIVDDGSTDGMGRLVRDCGDPHVRLEGYTPNRGKGCAVRTGMLAAGGDIILCTDADLAYGVDVLAVMLDRFRSGEADLVMSPYEYGLFCCFFGKLYVGPILGYNDFSRQLRQFRPSLTRMGEGVVFLLHGLAKKVILADSLTILAQHILAGTGPGQAYVELAPTFQLANGVTVRVYKRLRPWYLDEYHVISDSLIDLYPEYEELYSIPDWIQ